MREKMIKICKFAELPESVQNSIIEKRRQTNGEFFDGKDFVYDDAATIAGLFGLEINRQYWTNSYGFKGSEPTIYYTGFWSQGDGACFEGTYRYKRGALKAVKQHAPQDTTLHNIVESLQRAQVANFYKVVATCKHSGHYYHSGCMSVTVEYTDDSYRDVKNEDDFIQALREFADWLYSQLESAYDYETSEENAREYLENDDTEYTIDGEEV